MEEMWKKIRMTFKDIFKTLVGLCIMSFIIYNEEKL